VIIPANVKPPKAETLARYGLSIEDWWRMLHAQSGVCAICGKCPGTGRFNIDHAHVAKGGHWKTLPPERRRERVRALLCWTCNRLCVGRGVTIAKLRAAAAYLERFATQ
jgi:hypothetical protein